MSRVFATTAGPSEVVRHDDAPVAFRWRDRSYRVDTVLAHWVEAGEWWRPGPALCALDDREREFWRVEAHRTGVGATARPGAGGVYDLRFDWSAGTWAVTRVHD